MHCELITWQQVSDLSRKLAQAIEASGYKPDILVGIGRGGLTPARLLSDYLDIINLTSFKIEHYHRSKKSESTVVRYPLSADIAGLKVLLIDDVSDAGDTFKVGIQHIHDCGPPAEIRTAALHHKLQSNIIPDFYAAEILEWRWLVYPWAIIEDISGFIHALNLTSASTEEIRTSIHQAHGIWITPQTAEDARAVARRIHNSVST